MKYAIVESGGKQYKAVEGGTIDVDRLKLEAGKQINLENVLLVSNGDTAIVGTPMVKGAKIKATVVEEFKGPKVIIFKYHPRKRYRVKRGHRQWYTRLQIETISGLPASEKKTEAAEKEAEKPKAKAAAKKTEKPASRPLSELDLNKGTLDALANAGVKTTAQFLKQLAQGDKAVLAIEGFGAKGLEDVKKALQEAGYELP